MQKKFNLKYAASMTGFFSLFASMFSFVSVYLLHNGYDNATIGTVLAFTGISTILIQTMQASFLDKRPSFRLQDAISVNLILVILGAIVLLLTNWDLLILGLIVFIFAFAQASETLLNSMAFIFEPFGIHINYGFGRGMGSAAFAVMTMIIGYIVEATSPNAIPVFYLVLAVALLLLVRSYNHPMEKEELPEEVEDTLDDLLGSENTLFEFFNRYKRLIALMVGVICIMFTHTLVNNFFIQIIMPVGGNSALMGTAIFIGAIVELPTMLGYSRIESRISANNLLKLSAVFFLAKHVLTYFAPNMTVIYIAQFLQFGAFALIYPACVSYIRTAVSKKDAVKGQSLFTSAIAASSVLGSFMGGILLDEFGVPTTLMAGIIANIIGLVIIFIATEDKKVVAKSE